VVVRLRLGGGGEERAGASPAAAGEERHRRGRGGCRLTDLRARGRVELGAPFRACPVRRR
jgi:hypothetical protein